MKTLKQILTVIFVLSFITSCEKDENDPKETLGKDTISAKWIVSSLSEYESFEFNESGNYIVVKNTVMKSIGDQIILFGTYEIIDNSTVLLSDFGTIGITAISDSIINFSILLASNNDKEIIINASRQEEIENSTKTELLCRTWKMASVNGEDVVGTEKELLVLFSKAGTYFVDFSSPQDENERGIANWKWSDATETKFLYSWKNPPVWDEDKLVEIIELTNNSLKVLEKFDEGEDDLYSLVPVINTKSATIKSNAMISSSENQIKVGFLKK